LSLHPSINPSCIDEPLIGSSPVLLFKVSDHQTEVLSVLPPIQAAGHSTPPFYFHFAVTVGHCSCPSTVKRTGGLLSPEPELHTIISWPWPDLVQML
jgi:hypothetical protein